MWADLTRKKVMYGNPWQPVKNHCLLPIVLTISKLREKRRSDWLVCVTALCTSQLLLLCLK